MEDRTPNTMFLFHTSFGSLGERERIWSPFGRRPTGQGISLRCIVEDQQPSKQSRALARKYSDWLEHTWQRQWQLGYLLMSGRNPNKMILFRTSFGSLGELERIWSPFGRQPIGQGISLRCIVEDQ